MNTGYRFGVCQYSAELFTKIRPVPINGYLPLMGDFAISILMNNSFVYGALRPSQIVQLHLIQLLIYLSRFVKTYREGADWPNPIAVLRPMRSIKKTVSKGPSVLRFAFP